MNSLIFLSVIHRQVKDQNKKVANLKHKEQVEKKKSAQMLEEARRREDNLNDSSAQLQVRAQSLQGVGEGLWPPEGMLFVSSPLCSSFSLSNPACCFPLRPPI